MISRLGMTYTDLILEALTRFGSREAFVLGERRVTYEQAADIIGRFIIVLERNGVGLGCGVAVLSPNAPEAWLAQAATYMLGGHFSGLQLLGSPDDHVFVCDDAQVSVLIASESHAEVAAEVKEKSATIEHLMILGPRGVLREPPALSARLTPGPAGEDDVAWLQYTGGTTGRPKGVMLPHRAMVHQVLSHLASWGIPEEPRYLAAGPITHASVLPVLPTLLRGGTVVLMPGFDPEAWLSTVQEERINYAFAVPTMLYALLDRAEPEAFDLSSLQTVVYGASAMSPSRLVEAMDRIGPVFQQIYGQTENLAVATTLRRDEHTRNAERLASCGRAVAGAVVVVLDEDGSEAPTDEIGELAVRTRAAMLGYRNLPDETDEVLGDGWVRSGDMARRDEDGFFYIVDRKKDVIISGGFNVYAREVEDVLTTHASVASAAVIGVPDEKWGEAVHAVVVARPGEFVDPTELSAFVKERKGAMYAPKTLEFADALPTTPVGKVDKKALRAPHWTGQERQVH